LTNFPKEVAEGKEFVHEVCTKAFEHFSSNQLGQVNFERFKAGLLDLNILFTDKEMSHLFFSMFDPSKGEGITLDDLVTSLTSEQNLIVEMIRNFNNGTSTILS
jgi:Ca2+-binding EF-hand superfamily protein